MSYRSVTHPRPVDTSGPKKAPRVKPKAVPEATKGKETLDAMLKRTRGYGLGERNPMIPNDARYDRARYWSAWGKVVRSGTKVVGMRFDHF